MSTPTMSRDNRYRIALRVEFRASIGELAAYLSSSHRHVEDMDRLANILAGLSIRQIHKIVRTEMERRGCDYIDGWADQFSYDETVRRLNIASQHVRRAFPELDKADREQKQQPAPAQDPAVEESPEALQCDWCSSAIGPREGVSFVGELICQRCYHKHGLSQKPAAIEPSDTCSVCGKEECANEVCGTEPAKEIPAPAACRHGNTPRQDVTGDPIKACEDGFNAPGYVEFGAFSPEGCFYSGDGCAVDAANAAAEESEGEEDITWGRKCSDHDDDMADHCRECNAEPEPTCTDCSGSGCHWCHWTGKRR